MKRLLIVTLILTALGGCKIPFLDDPEPAQKAAPAPAAAEANESEAAKDLQVLKQMIMMQEEILSLQSKFSAGTITEAGLQRLGNLYMVKGWFDEAEWAFKRNLLKGYNKVDGYNALGILNFRRRHMEEALEFFFKASKLAPHDSRTLNNLAIWHAKSGNQETAVKFWKKIIAAKDDFPEAYSNLGAAYNKNGAPEQAIAMLKKAIEINNEPFGPHFELAKSYEAVKDYPNAEKEYRFILASESSDPEALEGLERIQKLKAARQTQPTQG